MLKELRDSPSIPQHYSVLPTVMVPPLWGSSGSPVAKLRFQHTHPISAYDVLWTPETTESYGSVGYGSFSQKHSRVWTSEKSCSTKGSEAGVLFWFRLPRNHRRGKPYWQVDQLGPGRHRCPGFAGFQSEGLVHSP